jgi:hypothetical protein
MVQVMKDNRHTPTSLPTAITILHWTTAKVLVLACTLFAASCTNPAVHCDVAMDSLPPPMVAQPIDRHVLAGEWEYVEGDAVDRLTVDEEGNGHYEFKNGRFETRTLIGHTRHGVWFQKENDRDGGFAVEFSPDFSEGEERWWYSRIGTDHTITQKGGTFHLNKNTARMNHSDTPPTP